MPRSEREIKLEQRLGQVQDRLLEDIPLEELQRMQLQTDLLERALSSALDFHHHDTNEHHDHVTLQAEPTE